MKDENNYSPFYRQYLKLCEEHGFSAHGAVKAAGISSGSPTAWKGGAIPRPDQREKLCALFGVTDNQLLGYEKETPPPEAEAIGPNKRALLDAIDSMSEAEMALLLERALKIIASRD